MKAGIGDSETSSRDDLIGCGRHLLAYHVSLPHHVTCWLIRLIGIRANWQKKQEENAQNALNATL